MITREKKSKIIEELNDNIKLAKSMIFFNFHGVDVMKTNQLRRELKAKKALYKVAKKTLIKKALEQQYNFKSSLNLDGEVALIFNQEDNIIEVVKFILSQIKKDKFKILGGIFENEYRDAAFIIELSRLPSKSILYVNLLNALNSPLGRLVGALNGGIIDFIRVLNEISKIKNQNAF